MAIKPTLKKVTIEVTKTDILEGKQGDLSSCAIARAAKRQGFEAVSVGGNDDFSFRKNGVKYAGTLPVRVENWIEKFDDATKEQLAKMKPASFTIAVRPVVKN